MEEVNILKADKIELPVGASNGRKNLIPYQELGWIQRLLCEHQGKIMEHFYLGSQIHKEMRLAIDGGDLKRAIDARIRLEDSLMDIFKDAWEVTVDALNNYFDNSRGGEYARPGVCLKATQSSIDGIQEVVDIFRENSVVSDNVYPVDANTGFKTVLKNGKYYLCNDIPTACSKLAYENPRLNKKKASFAWT